MKKVFRISFIILISLALIVFGIKYFLGGNSRFNSIYLVPENAVLVVESERPIDAWNSIVYSKAWHHLSQIESIRELNYEILSVDSIVRSNRLLLKLVGNRKVTFSVHQITPGKYENLLIVDLGNATKLSSLQGVFDKVLGEGYKITQRKYKKQEIFEIHDRESSEMMYASFFNEKLIFSYSHILIEQSIDEAAAMTLGRDLDFIEVYKQMSGNGLFTVYIQYKYLPAYVESMAGSKIESINNSSQKLSFSGLSFDIDQDGLISLEGFSTLKPETASVYNALFTNGRTQSASQGVVPQRVASLLKINFDDASEYIHASLKSSGEREYQENLNIIRKTEKKLDISLEENLFSWMDKEILLLQTRPSNLGRDNEFALIVKAKNEKLPKENLDYIEKKIQKNSPVKIKKVGYEGYEIHYLSFPGILKALFGRMIGRLQKPYYTILNDQVIFSNHPQTIKNIIDDYKAGLTLDKSSAYFDFQEEFDKNCSAFSYFDVPVLFTNLKAFVDAETWNKLNKNKEYITSFSQVGLQTSASDGVVHFLIKAKYQRQVEKVDILKYTNFEFSEILPDDPSLPIENKPDTMAESTIVIPDLDASNYTMNFEDGSVKIEIDLKNGFMHGSFKEYYRNGGLKIKGKYKNDQKDGVWKYYDWEGNLLNQKLFKDGNFVE